jgi:hypothetical protein
MIHYSSLGPWGPLLAVAAPALHTNETSRFMFHALCNPFQPKKKKKKKNKKN